VTFWARCGDRPRRPPLAGPAAAADEKMVFKASTCTRLGYPTVEAVQSMGKSGGGATKRPPQRPDVFAAMQLGGEKEAIEQAQVGAIQLARVSVGALGPVVDDLNVFKPALLFRNTEHAQKVMDRADRAGAARQGHRLAGRARRAVLDGCRCAQHVRHQRADQLDCRFKGMKVRVVATRCSSR